MVWDGQKSKQLARAISLLKLVSHPTRLAILCELLHQGELRVNEIVATQRKISQSQTSQFLLKMKADGLIESRKHGRYVYYKIKSEKVRGLIKALNRLYCS